MYNVKRIINKLTNTFKPKMTLASVSMMAGVVTTVDYSYRSKTLVIINENDPVGMLRYLNEYFTIPEHVVVALNDYAMFTETNLYAAYGSIRGYGIRLDSCYERITSLTSDAEHTPLRRIRVVTKQLSKAMAVYPHSLHFGEKLFDGALGGTTAEIRHYTTELARLTVLLQMIVLNRDYSYKEDLAAQFYRSFVIGSAGKQLLYF